MHVVVQHCGRAEHVTGLVGIFARRAVLVDGAGRHEVNGIGRRALARDLDVGRQVVGVQQRQDFGGFLGIESRQHRHARHQAPIDHEIAAVNFLRKARRNNRDRQSQNAQAP